MVIYLPKFKYPESKREVNNIMVGIVDKAVKVWVIFLRKIHFSNVFYSILSEEKYHIQRIGSEQKWLELKTLNINQNNKLIKKAKFFKLFFQF